MLVGPGPMENADHPPLVGSDRPDPFVPSMPRSSTPERHTTFSRSTTTTEVKCPCDTFFTRLRVPRRWALMQYSVQDLGSRSTRMALHSSSSNAAASDAFTFASLLFHVRSVRRPPPPARTPFRFSLPGSCKIGVEPTSEGSLRSDLPKWLRIGSY